MVDPMIHPGSIAFLLAFHDQAEEKLDSTFGKGKINLVLSGACTEHPQLTRFIVEVHDEADAMGAGARWLSDVRDSLRDVVGGPIHVCSGRNE